MTDRVKGFTVTLEKDIRVDDVEPLRKAIEQLRGVIKVDGVIATFEDHFAEARVRRELGEQLFAILYPSTGKK